MSLSFARGALHGVDRFVPQVRKITFFYCKHGGSSKGMRDFIQKDLVEFAKANPSIVMEARIRGNEHPYIRGEYMNGNVKTIGVRNDDAERVLQQAELIRTTSGFKVKKFKKWWHTDRPSLQGEWHPFLK